MAANSALDKKLRRAIGILEGNPPQRTGIPTPKRHKDPLVEACHEVRKVLVDEEYWPKTYTSRALSGLFDVLDKDDASLRILADQCLNGILRKFLTKGQTSRTLAILLNELGRKASARGFVAALTMLESTLRYAKEARLPVYAMHLLNSLKEAVKRPEQAVQSVVEQLFAPIFEYFKNDLNDSHYNYVDALAMQCLENLQLSGVSNRAASAVLAGIFENFPRIRAKIVYSLLDTLRSAEEVNDKNRLVGAFNTFKKLWKNLESADVIHSILFRVLCSLRTQSSEIQTAGLELLDEAISSTSLEILKFQPASFTDSENGRSSIPESLGNLSINEKELSFDVDEGATMSRFNSVNSLEESVPPSARSEVSEEDVFNNASDDEDTNSGRTSKSGAEIETDPLFRRSSPSEYLLDNVEEPETQESPSHSAHEAIYGPLCAELPKTRLESTANFLDYTGYRILSKFLFTGTPGELKSDSEVRVSIKVLALKVLAAISGVYYKINELVIGQQHFSDIQILIQNSDDAVSVRCFEVLTNLETEMIRKGTKIWPITPPTKFSMHLSQLTRQPNPMKLKELFQVLNKAHLLLQADQNTLKSVLNLAIDTFECDYFLLKVVRAEFLAHIKWDLINPATREAYQRKCFLLLIKSLFDSDYRVASAVSELLPIAVKNAEFSQLSNTFNCQWPEEMAAPSFAYQPQVFALHPNYSFRGDCPDLVLEHSLTTTIAMLYEEVSTRNSDFSHFILGLLKLAEHFSPCVYGQAWACPDNKSQRSVLDIVLEQTDGFTTNPSDFINALRLISLIFCGLMENSLSQYANQPKEKDFLQGNAILDQVITVYLRVLNLYFTVIRENTTKLSSTMNSPLFTKRNWVQGGVNSSAYENRSYSISHLVGTGVHPTRPTSYTQSASLKRIEPLIRGAFSNLQSSLKKQTEERVTILLNTALDGLASLLELTSREIMNSFIDELFIYIRTLMHFSLAPVTKVITQLLKNIFDKNAFHINSNTLVSLRLKNAVMPNDPLEMYIGRSINNFSVYLAFLDRSEHFTLHQLRHFGWMNKTIGSPVPKRSANHALEIGARLEQFERFVTFLMHAFLNNSQKETRENILSLLGVLVTNDVRYDKLDPQSRIWKSVLQFIRHPTLKYVEELKNLFTFVCLATRVIDVSFDEVIILMGKCLEKLDKTNADDILDALHVVLLEAVGYYVKVPQTLIDLLKQENTSLFSISPAKTIQLWTLILHWARTTQPDLFYQDLSTNFVHELGLFIDKNGFKTFKNRKMAFEVGNSIIIGLKTCHPNTFRPINNIAEMLIKSLDVGWIESLPFISFLLCRIDLDIVLVQLKDIIDEPVEKLSRALSQLLLAALDEIFESTENLAHVEEALSFFHVSLLHIFRANPAFHKQFKTLISDALRQKDFIQKILRISFLTPKVYGTFMTILVQLDHFEKEIAKLYSANSLPHNAKQLSTLLLIQKATDRRASASPEFEDFLLSLPPETTVRFVKMLTEKQISSVKERFSKQNIEKIVEKCEEYLRSNPILGLEYGLNLLAEKEEIRSDNSEKRVQLTSGAGLHMNLIDGINQKSSSTVEDDLDCLAQMALQMEKEETIGVIEAISDIFRPTFLTKIFEYLNDELRKITIENYRIDKMRDSSNLMKFVEESLNWISKNNVNPRDVQSVLNGVSRIPSEFEEFERIRIQNFDEILNNGFVIDMIESDLSGLTLQADFYTALTELIKRSDLTAYDNNDQFCIENLSNFFSMTIDQLERQIPKTDRLKIDKNWKLVISGEDENDEILEAFLYSQKAAHILQMKKLNGMPNQHFEAVKKAILSILRLNVFSKMFLFPQKALVRGVSLQIEPQKDKISIPMISIHLLSDFEILSDFLQRIFLLGWTKKSQFEEIWMSLFGVLCSTPIGNELQGEDVQQIVDQLSASTLAVEALTGMLTMSLLYPTPGDTVNSRFMIKTRQTRDSYLFLNSLNGRKAAISRTQVENSFNPAQIFSANLEKLSADGQKYALGQTSVFYLWSITGELEPTNKKPSGMPKSVSDYLIQASTDLDTVSSLKSLFENFFHWFENGYKTLPLPLLAASIKSIAILSDMFDDIQLYVRVYGYLKEVFVSFHLQNHPAQGLLNYCLLKFAAIVDLERLDSDPNEARKIVDSMIADAQEEEDTFVLDCTLHGLLYLLQSVIVDEFQQQLKGVGEKVLGKLEKIHSNYDLIHEDELETVEHHKLLWTLIFRVFEQFGRGDSEFDQRFLKLTKTVLMDPRVPTWQKNIVSNGIQALVCHSASFTEAFRDCAVELFDTYQLRPNHLSMALSVYFTCVYRSIQDNRRFSQQQMDQFRQEFQKILNLFSYYTLKSEIQRFLPPIAEFFLIFFTRNELFDTLFALISMDEKSETIGDYDRCLYHLLHYALQRSAKEKPKETLDFVRFFLLEKVQNVKNRRISRHLKALIMVSVGYSKEARLLIPQLLRRNPDVDGVYNKAKEVFIEKANSLNIKLGEQESSLLN